MAENTFVSLGIFYGDVAVISFAAGGGLGAVLGALYHLGLCLGVTQCEQLWKMK